MKIKNFLFHRVSPQYDELWPPMHPKLFEKCIKYIKSRYDIIRIDSLHGAVDKNKPLATISFDDGYLDNFEYAYPILKKNNCPASFYVVTDCIDQNMPTWTYIFDYKMQYSKKISWKINFGSVSKKIQKSKWSSIPSRKSYAITLKPILKQMANEEREQVLTDIFQSLDDVTIPTIMMDWDHINELKQNNFEIGSHSLSHIMFDKSNSKELIYKELKKSANKIKDKIGLYPTSIAYPIGSYNDQTIELAKKAGYKRGLAVHQRSYNTETDNIFSIPRIELYNEPWIKTKSRMNGSLELIKNIFSR